MSTQQTTLTSSESNNFESVDAPSFTEVIESSDTNTPETDPPPTPDSTEGSRSETKSSASVYEGFSKVELGQLHRLLALVNNYLVVEQDLVDNVGGVDGNDGEVLSERLTPHITTELGDVEDAPNYDEYNDVNIHPWNMLSNADDINTAVSTLFETILTDLIDGEVEDVAKGVDAEETPTETLQGVLSTDDNEVSVHGD